MFDLFKSEFKRFRLYALGAGVLHIIVWKILAQFSPTLQPSSNKLIVLTAASIGFGAILGIVSTYLHKRKNHWTYLVHRPMTLGQIHGALSASAIACIAVVSLLPMLLTIGFVDFTSNQPVELRHYLVGLHYFLMGCIAYFIGSFALLARSKLALLALPILLYVDNYKLIPVQTDLLLDLGFLIFSWYLARSHFMINPDAKCLENAGGHAAVLALQPVMILIFVSAQALYYHIPKQVFGTEEYYDYADDSSLEKVVTFEQTKHLDADQGMRLVLQNSVHADKASLLRQTTLSEFKYVSYDRFRPLRWDQLFTKEKAAQFAMNDVEPGVAWIFSHKHKVFVGINLQTNEPKGYLGKQGFVDEKDIVGDADKFDEVPRIIMGTNLMTSTELYSVDFNEKTVTHRFQLKQGEVFERPPSFLFDRTLLVSDQATYMFDAMDFQNPHIGLTPQHIITHPVAKAASSAIAVTEVLNGFLLLYADYNLFGEHKPGFALNYVEHDGAISQIDEYRFQQFNHPEVIRYQPFLLSPVVMSTLDAMLNPPINYRYQGASNYRFPWQRDIPVPVWLLSLGLMMLSGLTTWFLLLSQNASSRAKFAWILTNTLLSLPGLLGFLLLNQGWRLILETRSTKHTTQTQAPRMAAIAEEQPHV